MRGVAVAVLALLGTIQAASADELSNTGGRVTRLRGLVTVERAGASDPARKGYLLQNGDTIKTGSDGVVQWWMVDDSLFLLPSGSSLHIDEYQQPEKKAGGGIGKSFFSLLKGAMRSVTGLIAKSDPQSYRVATPVATMGVRGTDFKLVYCNNDCALRKNSLRKSSLRGFDLLMPYAPARLIHTAETKNNDPPVIQNGAYVKMEKLTGVLSNDKGSVDVTFGVGSGCAFAADANTAPVLLPKCPPIFERFGDELEWEFDDNSNTQYRDLRRPERERPASPS